MLVACLTILYRCSVPNALRVYLANLLLIQLRNRFSSVGFILYLMAERVLIVYVRVAEQSRMDLLKLFLVTCRSR